MARFWIVVLPLARAQLRHWRHAAAAIPDPELRAQALATLDSERLSAAGAALFAATTGRRGPPASLVRALVSYQLLCDFLDTLSEQPSVDPIGNGTQLHRALPSALDPGAEHPDYYRLHRARDDGGYLASLVDACREGCATLPAYEQVRPLAIREARRNGVQGINHAAADERAAALRRWAATQEADGADVAWFELAAAGSSSLAVLALIAAAADPATCPSVAERVRRAYFPWTEALSTLLDSLVDRERDVRSGELSFVGYYPSRAAAIARLRQLAERALAGVRALPRGERHVVLVTGMIAMHLSEDDAATAGPEPATRALLQATQTPATRLLLAILRAWRRARGLRMRTEHAPADQARGGVCQPLFSPE